MLFKKINKSIRRTGGWLALIFCSLIIRILPKRFLYGFAGRVANLGYYLAGRHRRIALESLELAFGEEKSLLERKRIVKKSFKFMAQEGIEFMFLLQRPYLIKERVSFEKEEILKACLSRKKGVILLTAHFGNFPLLLSKLSLEGYPVYGIMRRMRDEKVERIFSEKRRALGINTIYSQPRKFCVEESLRVLREGKILCIQLDQNFGSGGVFVDFFGKKAATATGPVVLALRTGASILPCFILHSSPSTYRVVFEPEYKIKLARTLDETILLNIQELTGIIETYIRRYPEEWSWIHRRWKSRPQQENY
ncbi:MAG: lysophospholipid acyltransferase family protein [Candidatus Omnitrophica bacterium]|nr:lysophospholipid acyltransferase family protein [Candidatus Omnitrophota bacterium]